MGKTKPRIVLEAEFFARLKEVLVDDPGCGWITGPGRSGAIAAVYASHFLAIPFVPYGSFAGANLGRVLLIDTARESGRTLTKAVNKYKDFDPVVRVLFEEPPRVCFWYEAPKPQTFRHEVKIRDEQHH